MDRRKYQLALMTRGIRLSEDDPIFILLDLIEIQFDDLASKHLHAFDKQTATEIVTQVLSRQPQQQNQSRCVGGASVERTAHRLESVAATFGQLEDRMTNVAQLTAIESARFVAGKVLSQISKEVNATLLKFESFGDHTTIISESATRMINASRFIHEEAKKTKQRSKQQSLLYAAIAILIFAAGITLGNFLTSNTLVKVQAACAMQRTQ